METDLWKLYISSRIVELATACPKQKWNPSPSENQAGTLNTELRELIDSKAI